MPKRFDEDLQRLKQSILTMGALAEAMIQKTISALVNRRTDLVREVLSVESRMDSLQREIDAETVRLISVFTPVAEDLRVLLMITRINAELERTGDQTVAICHTYQNLAMLEHPPLKPLEDLPRMAAIAADMQHQALAAFLSASVEGAMAVIAADHEVDELNDRIFRELLGYIVRDARDTGRALGLILTARGFERIADHAVNIAEDVVYIVRGEDIRHTGK